jgi:hypothetical protein
MENVVTTIIASAERDIAAPADRVYRILANYRDHHPNILPDAFSNFTVEKGGIGAGTVIRFRLTIAGLGQDAHQRIEEPAPGWVLAEQDLDRDLRTTFTVTPNGSNCRVRIDTVWNEGGLQGLVMRLFTPRLLGSVFRDELDRLDRYARDTVDA